MENVNLHDIYVLPMSFLFFWEYSYRVIVQVLVMNVMPGTNFA